MENATMGKVVVTARNANLNDLYDVRRGLLSADKVRRIEVTDALVDTGASTLSLPKQFVSQLGLEPFRVHRARTRAGLATQQVYEAVRLTVQDRQWTGDVVEVPDDCSVLIGQLPLEGLDLVVDPVNQRLVGNPEHGGEQMIELY